MTEDKKRKEKDLMPSELLCGFVLQLLYLSASHAGSSNGHVAHPAAGRPAKIVAVNTRLKRCSNFLLPEIQSETLDDVL